jgi:hypothetical protein
MDLSRGAVGSEDGERLDRRLRHGNRRKSEKQRQRETKIHTLLYSRHDSPFHCSPPSGWNQIIFQAAPWPDKEIFPKRVPEPGGHFILRILPKSKAKMCD